MEKETDKKASLLADDLTSLESYIHDLFTFSPLPLCFVSPIGVLLEVNPSFEELSGLKSYELIGEPIEDLFDKKAIDKIVKDTLSKGIVRNEETYFFPKKGNKIISRIFTKVRKDEKGDTVGYFLCVFDMSDIKKEIEKLKGKVKKTAKKKK